MCQCKHSKTDHQHYRRGTDCAHCACARYHFSLSATLEAIVERRRLQRPRTRPATVALTNRPGRQPGVMTMR